MMRSDPVEHDEAERERERVRCRRAPRIRTENTAVERWLAGWWLGGAALADG